MQLFAATSCCRRRRLLSLTQEASNSIWRRQFFRPSPAIVIQWPHPPPSWKWIKIDKWWAPQRSKSKRTRQRPPYLSPPPPPPPSHPCQPYYHSALSSGSATRGRRVSLIRTVVGWPTRAAGRERNLN